MINIRNFAIIAHVDHGKSTLADRILEITGVVEKGKHVEQLLDKNPISRERGITIKLAPVRMMYQMRCEVVSGRLENEVGSGKSNDQKYQEIPLQNPASHVSHPTSYKDYLLNLIDTPGHVDFSYEVERTLASVEGAILLVDATQGIQAQTIAHTYKAIEQNLAIIPVVNKIDISHAQVKKTKEELSEFLGINENDIYEISAKTGQNIDELLKVFITTIPPPISSLNAVGNVRALIFDSYFDQFRGVIAFVRVFNGMIKKGEKLKLIATNCYFEVEEVGIFTPNIQSKEDLRSGEIGYIVTKLKDIHQVHVGDTIQSEKSLDDPLPGYRKNKPMVFASVFPTDSDDFVRLKDSLEKLSLNDASLSSVTINSKALGSGFRVGFLGLLHADVVRERLEREFDLSIILTPPTVEYKQKIKNQNEFEEPITDVTIVTPQEYTGPVMRLCEQSRGRFITMDNKIHIYLHYEIPLAEIVATFFDQLKTVTSGFASFDWTFKKYESCDAGKLLILINGDPVEEFSEYVVTQRSQVRGQFLTSRLKDLIPRQQYEVRIQAEFKGKIIASTRVAPYRKDVTGKLYGGDRTRKDKLLDKQKKGKKSMKNIGKIEIPKEVFLNLFKNR